ncbi:MAG: S46 family peptidase [Phycisphaerales bacterium]
MKRSALLRACLSSSAAALVALAGVATPSVADEGMWLLNNPPRKQLKERYNFEPTPDWLLHMQRSAVRIGASGSFVSANGLLMTNHHVASDMIAQLSTAERDLMKDGFLAKTRADELKCPGTEVRVLWTIEDVTDAINAAAKPDMAPAAANAARRAAMGAMEKEKGTDGNTYSVVTLYAGGKYHLYGYKRFTDVRLVFAPEHGAAFFGGDTDNFEYPRFNLDCTFLRVYENDKPVQPEHYLKWSAAGAAENDLVFIIGHPGRTQRQLTMDHLAFIRDVDHPARLHTLWRDEQRIQAFMNRSADNARIGSDDFYGIANSRKAIMGQYAGLLDPAPMKAKAQAEADLRKAVAANPEWQKTTGDAWAKIAAAAEARKAWHVRYGLLSRGTGGDLFRAARTLVMMADELPKPAAERLREFGDAGLPSLKLRLFSDAPIHPSLEKHNVASALSLMAELLGGNDPLVVKALAGKSPTERAAELVSGTKLADVAFRKKLADGGRDAIDSADDAMITFAKLLDSEYRAARKVAEDTFDAVERDAYSRIAKARFAIEGENSYPDATGTLRVSYGAVKGWTEDGAPVPAFTTIGGTFERAEARKGQKEFVLPDSWLKNKDKLDPKTPFNFTCTADIIGGNSGSPVVNKSGEVVGLVFDGNLHSLPGSFYFDERVNRAVVVDSRAMIEAMRVIYGADNVANELLGK